MLQRSAGRLLFSGGLLAIAAATLTPLPPWAAAYARATPLACLVCGGHGGTDIALNVLLFVPLGAGLALLGLPWPRIVAAAAAVTLTVELLQLSAIPGRDATLSDLVTNTAGAALGGALGRRLPLLLRPTPRQAGGLIALAAPAWIGLFAAASWLFTPWAPAAPLPARWGSGPFAAAEFGGRVVRAELSGAPIAAGTPFADRALGERLRAASFRVEVEATAGRPTPGWAPIAELGPAGHPILAVRQRGRDLALVLPARAWRLRLRSPAVRVTDALPGSAGAWMALLGERRGGRVLVAAHWGDLVRAREVALSPAYAWVMLLPFTYALGPEADFIAALWLAALAFPLGYWTARLAPTQPGPGPRLPAGRIVLLLAVLAAGLALAPLAFGAPVVHWSGWVATAAGAGGGWALPPPPTYLLAGCASRSSAGSCSS